MMKIVSAAVAAVLFAIIGWCHPAAAQGVPRGSYLGSCDNIDMRGDTLVASCRRPGGGRLRTALAGVHRCVGDIGSSGGVLQCTYPNGAQARGQVVQGRDGPPDRDDARDGRREHCRELHARAEDLRARRDWAWYPDERARVERRLRRVEEEMRESRCRAR